MAIERPLNLIPIPVPKVWGGTALRDFVGAGDGSGIGWPEDEPVGEVWLVSDREGRASVVADGPFAGRTLRGLMLSESDALLGDAEPSPDGSFPLLIKFLEARQNLSIQVHPDAAAAKSLGSTAKSECWYVLRADEDSEVLLGLADEADATSFGRAASGAGVVDLLDHFSVREGDGIDVPAGTVHSIGAGIAIAEVQNNSDSTYRIYDWDRVGLNGEPRDMHLDDALKSIDYERPTRPPGPLEFEDHSCNRRAILRDGEIFTADILDVHEVAEIAKPGVPTAIVVLSGGARIETGDNESYLLQRGQAWLLPADLEHARVADASGELRLLRARPTTK